MKRINYYENIYYYKLKHLNKIQFLQDISYQKAQRSGPEYWDKAHIIKYLSEVRDKICVNKYNTWGNVYIANIIIH